MEQHTWRPAGRTALFYALANIYSNSQFPHFDSPVYPQHTRPTDHFRWFKLPEPAINLMLLERLTLGIHPHHPICNPPPQKKNTHTQHSHPQITSIHTYTLTHLQIHYLPTHWVYWHNQHWQDPLTISGSFQLPGPATCVKLPLSSANHPMMPVTLLQESSMSA